MISTHSPAFINAMNSSEQVQVFHLRLENGATTGGPISEDTEALTALNDLGVKASDILQSNCVIWVEGPSDRIYVKRWLELVSPSLIEGRDYSIMFYGGRLLSHLNAERDGVPDELIPILRINQNAIVVMDSDRKSDRDVINETKQRIQKECECNGGICWVTDGREIENYLSENVLASTCMELLGKEITVSAKSFAKFDHMLAKAIESTGAGKIDYSTDKPKYARIFAKYFALANMSDQLKSRVAEIAEKINRWNE